MLTFDKYSGDIHHGTRHYKLTQKEMDYLLVLYKHLGQNVSRKAIFSALYPKNHEPTTNALDVMMHLIRKKLAGSVITIQTIQNYGFKMALNTTDDVEIIGGIDQ